MHLCNIFRLLYRCFNIYQLISIQFSSKYFPQKFHFVLLAFLNFLLLQHAYLYLTFSMLYSSRFTLPASGKGHLSARATSQYWILICKSGLAWRYKIQHCTVLLNLTSGLRSATENFVYHTNSVPSSLMTNMLSFKYEDALFGCQLTVRSVSGSQRQGCVISSNTSCTE